MTVCRHCQHDHAAHQHYREGTDCALCECMNYGRPHWWNRRRTPTSAPVVDTEADQQRRTA